MARKVKEVIITAPGRDENKIFIITESPVTQAEKWAIRAFMGLAKAGIEIPDNVESAGLAGIAMLGMKALASMDFREAEPLLDEMMSCVAIRPDPTNSFVRARVENDIEEISTILKLRMEVFSLHTGFSLAADQSASTSATPSTASSHTPMSHAPSAPSSPRVRQPRPSSTPSSALRTPTN